MSGWLLVIAAIAAVAMTVLVWWGRPASIDLLVALLGGAVATGCSAGLATLTGGMPVVVAAAIATGSAPMAAFVVRALRAVGRRAAVVVSVTIWAVVVVPVAIVVPQWLAAQCADQACIVEDFAGGLPFVIATGAFLLVPSATAPRGGAEAPLRQPLAASALLWIGFVVWLCTLELAIDEFTRRIAIAAVVAPALGAIGWVVADRIRGLDRRVLRGVRFGLVAGAAATLSSTISVSPWWSPLVGVLAGIVGAMVYDARALRTAPVLTRMSVASVVVGTLGMIVPGILGTSIGFVFAARVDVLGTQVLASIGVAIFAAAVSIPAEVVLRRNRP